LGVFAGPDRSSLRVVIQQIDRSAKSVWRVIAYGGKEALGPADFLSRQAILFAEEMELNDAQLSIPGLT